MNITDDRLGLDGSLDWDRSYGDRSLGGPAPQTGLASRIGSAALAIVARIRSPSLPPRYRSEVLVQQGRLLAITIGILSVAGLSVLAVLMIDFVPAPIYDADSITALVTAAVYVAILVEVARWSRRPQRIQHAERFIVVMTVLTASLGLGWGTLSVLLSDTPGNVRNLLFGIDVGLVSASAVLIPRGLALGCWFPTTIGGFVTAFSVHSGQPAVVGATFVGYAVMVAALAVVTNRTLVLRTVARLQIDEQREVIQLLLRDFEQNASDWLWETDGRLRLTHVSSRLAEVTSMSPLHLRGLSFRTLVSGLTRGASDGGDATDLIRKLDAREPIYNHEIRVRVADEERHWNITCEPVRDPSGDFLGYRGVGSDVTGLRVSAREIEFLAQHDMLTGLPNRRLAGEHLAAAFQGGSHSPFSLLCIDLDGFKDINDRFGHSGGDALLIVVAQRLRDSVRQDDLVARLGGDEFAVVLRTADEGEVVSVIRRILASLSAPLHIQGLRVQIGASIGAARAPADAADADSLLHHADLALYRAKESGRATWRFFAEEMAQALVQRQAIEQELRRAVGAGELFLEYRPVVDIATARVVGAEALVRWAHPVRGHLLPEEFLPYAEQAPLMLELGAWVLRRAAREASAWPHEPLLSVRVSPLQLQDTGLSRIVEQAIAGSGLAPDRFEIAIDGAALAGQVDAANDLLAGLRATGVRVALADFGVGTSSLQQLRLFPFDRIKVSAEIVRGIETAPADLAIVRSVLDLGDRLGIGVVVDGVETEGLHALVAKSGGTLVQGALFGGPVGATRFGEILLEAGDAPNRSIPSG